VFTRSIRSDDKMSQAFVKESDDQWLHDIPPTVAALINYLTRENNGIRVYERGTRQDPKTGKTIYAMSNGIDYVVDNDNRWTIVD
jgi:hypothetical protein